MTLRARVELDLDGFSLDVALEVHPDETVAIVGPNGAGKTTLLRALAGLLALSGGRVELDGHVLDEPSTATYVPPERRPVGMVFPGNLLFPHLDALDNVAFGLRTRGVGRTEARRRAADWLRQVGLGGREGARPDALSGGQAQRVALARALAPGPALLLLDEPLASLDADTRNQVRRDLRHHLAAFGGRRVLVTHDPVDAAVLADRVVVLHGGRVAQEGTPAEITARPRTSWVAELAGTNLFSGRAGPGGIVAIDGGGHLTVVTPVDAGPVFAVVHPRAVSLHRGRPHGSARNAWPGRVVTLEAMGDRLRVRLSGEPPVVAEITPAAATDLGIIVDARVWVAVKATEIDVYPA